MGTEPGSVKSKKEKAKEKVKEYQVVKYGATDKTGLEKHSKLLDKENLSYSAVIVRALRASKEPLTLIEVLEAVVSGKVKHDAKANMEANVRWYLNDLKKKGLIKSLDEKVEAKSRDEARGVEA